MKKFSLLFVLLYAVSSSYGQEDQSTKVDTLTTSIIQNVYKDEPETVSNDSVSKRSSFNAYPFVYYTPESKFAIGGGGIYIFYTGKSEELKPSKIGFGANYTSNKQYKISMNNVYYFNKNKLYIHLPVSYGYFINKYWGQGKDLENYDDSQYAQQTFSATLTTQLPPAWFVADRTGLILDYDYTEIVDKMTNTFLQNDSLPGSNGGHLVGIGSDLVWDSRDNIFFPNSGNYQYFKAVIYPGSSDYTFAAFELDVRHYRAFKKDHVLAGNFFLQSNVGETPFYKLPSLGGTQMRGFFYGRYRDNFYAMAQMEYRQYFSKRWGFVVFGTLGNVANNILDYNFESIKYSFGTGIRYLFNQKEHVNLRADIGIGADGNTGIYFGIEEAF
jgi:outer membrane protein assembly factor BamA